MIRYCTLDQGRVVELPGATEGPILVCVNPTDAERALLTARYQLDEHNLTSALDRDELPRVELDGEHLAVIVKHPQRYSAKDNLLFRIESVGLFLFPDRLVVIAPEDLADLTGRQYAKIPNLQMLFLRIISACVLHFFGHLQVINDIANELESKIMHAMENRHLLRMFTIEKSLVYYINAISANGRMIERLKGNARNAQTVGLSPEMLEYVDDLAIENAQCLEQAQVYANVFTGLMDARASVVSNNQNVLIKRLTVFNVVFLPLNVIAGIGGMSEFSMMTSGVPWPVAYGLFILALAAIGLIVYRLLGVWEKKTRY